MKNQFFKEPVNTSNGLKPVFYVVAKLDTPPSDYPKLMFKKDRPAFDMQSANCNAWKRGVFFREKSK